ncbi:MAG: DUF4339 domain-containing protein [Deltaproteobacteria bacterium]|nr:DUF4339 domain-containing protein [Deltaproteobacteria bacterium]
MRHTCEHCHTVYAIPDHKVAGRFVKVRCKTCSGTMHVVGLDVGAHRGEKWWCALKGQPRGPFSRDEILLFVDLGDVSARTRLWRPGMAGWERVCESTALSWIYARVVERLSEDELLLAREPTRTYDPFANAALLSDGHGWFPDPTLKSGIFVLDEQTQSQLAKLAQTGALAMPVATPGGARPAWFTSVAAAAAGLALAVGGFAWLVAERLS